MGSFSIISLEISYGSFLFSFFLQIRDSNRAMLMAAAAQRHCKVLDLGIARDDEEHLERVLEKAISSEVDILLTSGGVSMGDRDYVKPLLEKRGTVHFNRVG